MPIITHQDAFDGAVSKVDRLGLQDLLSEVLSILTSFKLEVAQKKDGNGAAVVRRLIDEQFESVGGWTKKVTGGIDWTKCHQVNGTSVCIGVEVQVSGRSDLVAVDLIHLKNNLVEGNIDIGVLVVPDDELSIYLTDRTPSYTEALRHLRMVKAEDIPLFVIAFKHDGFGPALAKQKKNY